MKDMETKEIADAGKKEDVVTLIVNARPKRWNQKQITFREVVVLAYGDFDENPLIEYTVAYSNGPRPNPRGSMVDGDKVKVQERMNFNVTRTDKS